MSLHLAENAPASQDTGCEFETLQNACRFIAPNPRRARDIHVYAIPGPEREAFVALVESFSFNARASNPTSWRLYLHEFFAETGWYPERVKPVAGALLYTPYNFLIRLVMKHIAQHAGRSRDTSRDHEYTDWVALDHFVAV